MGVHFLISAKIPIPQVTVVIHIHEWQETTVWAFNILFSSAVRKKKMYREVSQVSISSGRFNHVENILELGVSAGLIH